MPSRRATSVLLAVALLAGCAALRLVGLDWLLPEALEQDAHIPVQVRLMDGASDAGARATDWGAYPHLVARLAWLLTPGEERGDQPGLALEQHLRRARWPVLRVRLVVALLSLLIVPATWLLARRRLGPGWSLLAAALAGTSLLSVHFGTQARPHAAAAGLFALAVAACVRLRERGDARSYALAGAAVGASLACLQSGVATLLPLAVAHAGVVRAHGRRRHALLLLPAAAVALSLAAFQPYLFEPGPVAGAAPLPVEPGVLQLSKHQVFLHLFNGLGFPLLAQALWEWEPALCVLAASGALLALARWRARARDPGRLVVLAFALPYALVVGLYARSYQRFLLPLVPFLALLGAWGLAQACARVRDARGRRAAAVLLAGAAVALPALVAVRLAAARAQPSTVEQAAAWVREHVRPGSERVVASRPLALPLSRTAASEARDRPVAADRGLGWWSYQRGVPDGLRPAPAFDLSWMPYADLASLEQALEQGPRRWIDAWPAELCVTEVFETPRSPLPLAVLTLTLRAERERLARFSPDGDGRLSDAPLAFQDEVDGEHPAMAWRVLRARRCGPVLEVFRLGPADAGAGR